jgi:hypothetical protein
MTNPSNDFDMTIHVFDRHQLNQDECIKVFSKIEQSSKNRRLIDGFLNSTSTLIVTAIDITRAQIRLYGSNELLLSIDIAKILQSMKRDGYRKIELQTRSSSVVASLLKAGVVAYQQSTEGAGTRVTINP